MTACANQPPYSEPPLTQPTLAELRALELRYDGPVPPHALADLRAVTRAQARTIRALNSVMEGSARSSS